MNMVRHDCIRVKLMSQVMAPISNGFDRHGRNLRPAGM